MGGVGGPINPPENLQQVFEYFFGFIIKLISDYLPPPENLTQILKSFSLRLFYPDLKKSHTNYLKSHTKI